MEFHKYHGAGNDFILIDGRNSWPFAADDRELIARLCHRRFGIGADGLMVLTEHPAYDFEMHYYNSDGRLSSMCGNGGRCIVAFADRLGLRPASKAAYYHFLAVDGPHRARLLADGQVSLEMLPVDRIEALGEDRILDTGSPHYVRSCASVEAVEILPAARKIRYGERFAEAGINVNFVEQVGDGQLAIRTYERGVEDETFACGTGVVAAAIVAASRGEAGNKEIAVRAQGGDLRVELHWDGRRADDIWLIGGASYVFSGEV